VKNKEDKLRRVYCYLIFLCFMHVREIAKKRLLASSFVPVHRHGTVV